jgi:uncharacterized protein (DUF58 family)
MLFPDNDKRINKLSFSVYCASALIHLLRKQRDAVGLTLFSDDIELHTEARSSSVHSKMLYSKLSGLLSKNNKQFNKKTHGSKILHQLAENIHKRSLIIIFSDMMDSENPDEIFSALEHLRYNKHEVILFHVIDKNLEQNFQYKNRPYRFIDMETGDSLKFNPNDVRNEYTKSINDYYKQIKLKCGQYKIDLVEADINSDFDEVLLSYLIKRKKLH